MKLATLALAAVIAVPAAIAQAHEGSHAAINGPSKLGSTTLHEDNHAFALPGITIDCPPPEGGHSCRVTATVRTRGKYRVNSGEKKRVLKLGRVSFKLGANRDAAEMHPVKINDDADKVLGRVGKLKTKVWVEVRHDEQTERYFSLTVNDHE